MDPNGSTTLTSVATEAVVAFVLAGDFLGLHLELESLGADKLFAGINCVCMRRLARVFW